MQPDAKRLVVNGYPMAYVEQGGGVPLVLVHGSLSDYRSWTPQMEPFGRVYRTIAVSLRHCYPERWDGSGGDFSIAQHAEDLAAFIQALAAGPVHLLGHSRGGDVALIAAAAHPRLVRGLILSDPAPLDALLPRTPTVRAEAAKRKTFVRAAMQCLRAGDLDGGLQCFTDAVTFPGCWNALPEVVKQVRRDNAWSLKALVADALHPFDCADAAGIEAPVLLLAGERSPRLYGMMHAALEKQLKQPRRVSIPASHGMNRENPEAFNAAVLDFLAAAGA